jgi:hypothetical protein
MPKCAWFFVAISVALTVPVASESLAQSPTPDSSRAPVTGMKPDRVTAPRGLREAMQKREAVKRQRRADCRAKARAEKVSLMKRPAFVKSCVARSS